MKRDEIRVIQSVMALNKPDPPKKSASRAAHVVYGANSALWEQLRDDFIRTLKMRNPKFVEQLFIEGCDMKPRKPVTIDHEDFEYAKSTRKRRKV